MIIFDINTEMYFCQIKQSGNSFTELLIGEIFHFEQMVWENAILEKSLERAAMPWGRKAEKSLLLLSRSFTAPSCNLAL